jgi:hypothetical protein
MAVLLLIIWRLYPSPDMLNGIKGRFSGLEHQIKSTPSIPCGAAPSGREPLGRAVSPKPPLLTCGALGEHALPKAFLSEEGGAKRRKEWVWGHYDSYAGAYF